MSISDTVPDDLKDEALDLFRRIAAGEKIESCETRRLTKDGETLKVWLTVTALVDEAGKVVEVGTTERDITARQWTRPAVQESAAP